MNPFTLVPRGNGILLGRRQPMPRELFGHVSWGAAYMSDIMNDQIADLRNAGAHDIYVWAEPDRWTGTNYMIGIDRAERICRENGLPGYIVDVERDMTSEQAFAFGRALKASVERGFSVGLTSFAGYRLLRDIADGCGGSVWTLCQIYNQGSNRASDFLAWLNRFRTLFGHCIPLIPTYIPVRGHGPELSSESGYEEFLAKVPASDAVGFYGTTHWMLARVATYRGAPPLNSFFWLFGLPTVAHMPLATSIVFVALVAIGIWLAYSLRKRF